MLLSLDKIKGRKNIVSMNLLGGTMIRIRDMDLTGNLTDLEKNAKL